ncbi:MAG: hypothetical protein HYV26_07620 [Candidatus Hydrogenedentes bacterium]|nr:hypothetical protein [Candidatus Hydrogenedentota bacterium]
MRSKKRESTRGAHARTPHFIPHPSSFILHPSSLILQRSGFTFVEALLSLVILTLIATVVTSVYYTGLKTYEVQENIFQVDSQLRSKMEYLLSLNFDQIVSGSQAVTIGGVSQTLTWTVANHDMDGDAAADATAKQIDISLAGHTITTLVADTTDKVFKL